MPGGRSDPQARGSRSLIPARLGLLACVVVWGWTFVAVKVCLETLHPVELVGLRFLLGLPCLLGIVLVRQIPVRFDRGAWGRIIAGSAILTTHFLVQAFALTRTTATNTGWIIAVTPLATAVLAAIILGERISATEVAGITIATAGIVLLVSRGDLGSLAGFGNLGDWLVLASAHTWALYTIATRDLSRSHHPLAVTLVLFAPLLLVCLAFMAVGSDLGRLTHLPPRVLAGLAFLAVPGTLAQWAWQEGVARIGASRAGVFLYLEPLATMVLAVPFLGESLGVTTVLGGTLVLGGVWWASRRGAFPS